MKKLMLGMGLLLTGCSDASQVKFDAGVARLDKTIKHFCQVNQPVLGQVTKITVIGVAAAVPQSAPVVPEVELVVGLVDGTCAMIGGVEVPSPTPGTPVLVPTS